jgi:hypothetical protein
MPKFIIEREIPGLGDKTVEQLRESARESNVVLRELGPQIQWIQSYVTGDKLYCEYIAESEDIILEHARCVDVPANRISRVETIIDPTTADSDD